MKRIAIAIAGTLIASSAFAANWDAAQPKPVDFNNGELATFPPKVEGYEPQTAQARNSLVMIDSAEENKGELAAYPLVPVSASQMARTQMRQDSYARNYSDPMYNNGQQPRNVPGSNS